MATSDKLDLIQRTAVNTIVFIVMAFSIAVGIYATVNRDLDSLPVYWLFNIFADIISLFVCLVIFAGCTVDRVIARRSEPVSRSFLWLLGLVFITLFSDQVAWLVKDQAQWRVICLWANSLFYASSALAVYYLWCYVVEQVGVKGGTTVIHGRVVLAVSLILVVLSLSNGFESGIFFTVDAYGSYHRESLASLSFCLSAVVFLSCTGYLVKTKELTLGKR